MHLLCTNNHVVANGGVVFEIAFGASSSGVTEKKTGVCTCSTRVAHG